MKFNSLAELYTNRDDPRLVDYNPAYTTMTKRPQTHPFSKLGGIRPYEENDYTNTIASEFNRDMNIINDTTEGKEAFYRGLQMKGKKEIKYLNRQNKKDHIKAIDSTLNFKPKPSQYTSTFEFSDEKKHDTDHPDDLHHYKKSFMKTYEECKLKHLNIIRK